VPPKGAPKIEVHGTYPCMVSSKHPGTPTPTIFVPPPENQLMLCNVDLRWPLRAALFSPLQQRCSSADPVQISVALFSADLPSASLARLPVIRLDTRRHRLNAAPAYNDGFSACCTRRITMLRRSPFAAN